MARIAGVDLPRGKRVDIALTYIYGIGRATALQILSTTGVNWERNIDDLSADEVNEIRKELEQNYKVEGDLRREISTNIKRLMDIGCFRGLRHRRGHSRTDARVKRLGDDIICRQLVLGNEFRKGPRRGVVGKKK